MKFKRGEVIVRDDSRYPEGALVVDGYDDKQNLRAHPPGGGFELMIPPQEQSRFSEAQLGERVPIFRPAKFMLEGLDAVEFEGWTDGSAWNGWAMPLFEFAAATEIASLLQDQLAYDSQRDAFVGTNSDEPEIWEAEWINLPDGGQVKVYAVGAGSWIWDEAEVETREGRPR